MFRSRSIIAALLLMLHSIATSACAAIIEFRDRAIVDPAGAVRLADIARIIDNDEARRTRLEELIVAPAPPTGRSVRIHYEDVRQRLLAQGLNLADIEVRGRSQISVTGGTAPATSAEPVRTRVRPVSHTVIEPIVPGNQHRRAREILDQALEREFRPATTSGPPLRFRCECAKDDAAKIVSAPAGQIRFDQPHLVAGGPQSLTAWWTNAAGQREQVTLQAWVETVPQGLGVKHPVPKGYVLQATDLTWAPLKDEYGLNVLNDAVGKETTRALKAGQPLQADDLASVPLVRSGDIVTVLVRRPGMVVRRQFKSNGSGALEDSITLTALDDPRVRVQAIVTGYHEATMVGPSTEPRAVFQDGTGAIQFVPATEGAR